jgi:hypothetical protein
LDEIAINEAIDGLLNISFSGFNNLSVQALDKIPEKDIFNKPSIASFIAISSKSKFLKTCSFKS